MKILWLSWKDREHPLAGGAEVVKEQLARRLAADGHEVVLLVGGFRGASPRVERDGYTIVRVGGRVSVYWAAFRYYRRHLAGWPDRVIDEVNTVPFFARLYVREPNLLFVHMLCRRIWFYEMVFPLSVVGYLLEPLYLRLLADRRVVTVSESTRADLARHGFRAERIDVISEGIEIEPVPTAAAATKPARPTLIGLGAIRPMKRTHHQVEAFELLKRDIPDLQLTLVGDGTGRYGRRVLRRVARSRYADDIHYHGKVPIDVKLELLREAHLLLVTSVKEGWGLVVTEAGSQATPAVVYDVDGLRDSVQDGRTGLVVRPSPEALAAGVRAALDDPERYAGMQDEALRFASAVTFDRAYDGLVDALCTADGRPA